MTCLTLKAHRVTYIASCVENREPKEDKDKFLKFAKDNHSCCLEHYYKQHVKVGLRLDKHDKKFTGLLLFISLVRQSNQSWSGDS
jgi:hypothetical protein